MNEKKNIIKYNDSSTQCQIELSVNDRAKKFDSFIRKLSNSTNQHPRNNNSEKIKIQTLKITNHNLAIGLKILSSSTISNSQSDTHYPYYYFKTKKKILNAFNKKRKKQLEKKLSCPIISQLSNRDHNNETDQHDFIAHKTVKGNTHWGSIQSQLIKEKLLLRNKSPFSYQYASTERELFENHFQISSRNQNSLNLTLKHTAGKPSFWRQSISQFHNINRFEIKQ